MSSQSVRFAASKAKRQKKRLKSLKKAAKKAAKKGPIKQVLAWPKPKIKKVKHMPALERKFRAPVTEMTNYTIGRPQFGGRGSITIKHREYLQQITTVTTFTGTGRYILNPGLQDNFPWLGQVAGSWENYKFVNVCYKFVTRAASTQVGSLYTATQYDPHDAEFKSVEEMMDYAGASSSSLWHDVTVTCDLAKRKKFVKQYFVRTDALAAGDDPQDFDMAKFTICAVGPANGVYVGDLFVEYTVKLFNPKSNPALVGAIGGTWDMKATDADSFNSNNMEGLTPGYANFSQNAMPVFEQKTGPSGEGTIIIPETGAYNITYTVSTTGTAYAAAAIYNTDGASISSYTDVGDTSPDQTTETMEVLTLHQNTEFFLAGGAVGIGNIATTVSIVAISTNYLYNKLYNSPTPPEDATLRAVLATERTPQNEKLWDKYSRIVELRKLRAELKGTEFKYNIPSREQLTQRLKDRIRSKQQKQLEETDNSDGEIVIHSQLQQKTVDRRSKSADRKQGDR